MATRVYPRTIESASAIVLSTERKTFTVWMKSLIFDGRGLAVFDKDGKVIYRIDNYGEKYSQQVLLMDFVGQVVFTIFRKSKGLRYPLWEGFKTSKKNISSDKEPMFRVKEHLSHHLFGRKFSTCEVVNETLHSLEPYKIVRSSYEKLECKIVNPKGQIIAELKQKHGCGGVMLGRDVLSLEVEPDIDVSFVVALVAVFGLIYREI